MRKAQSTLEYAVLVICIIAALISMQIYFKRGLAGKLRGSADSIGVQFSPGHTTGSTTITYSKNLHSSTTVDDQDRYQYSTSVTTTKSDSEQTLENISTGSLKNEPLF